MKKRLKIGGIIILALFLASSFFLPGVHRFVSKGADFLASVLPAVLVDLANSDRTSNSLHALALNDKLSEAAQMKADDMAAKSYFAHYSPEGKSPWYWVKQAGYNFAYAGENLAVNFDDSSAVNNAWLNSPGHRANILSQKFTEIGIATAEGVYQGRATTFVVQMFGSPAKEIKLASKSDTTKPVVNQKEDNLVTVAPESVLGASTTNLKNFIAVKEKTPNVFVRVFQFLYGLTKKTK